MVVGQGVGQGVGLVLGLAVVLTFGLVVGSTVASNVASVEVFSGEGWIAVTNAKSDSPSGRVLSDKSAFDPLTTAYVVTGGAGGDLPGCGALSAIDVASGEVLYRSPRLAGRSEIAASEDFGHFVTGRGAGGDGRLSLFDARFPNASDWTISTLWSPAGPHRIQDSAPLVLGDDLYLGVEAGPRDGVGLARIRISEQLGTPDLKDINPVRGFFSTRDQSVTQILASPDGRRNHVLSAGYRTAVEPSDVVESHPMSLHTLDSEILAARGAPVVLPPLVVNEPPGAGLREVGIHDWRQNGRLAWATMLPGGGKPYGPEGRYIVVNRWLRPELIIADMHLSTTPLTVTLPADFAFAGAVAANHGWKNPGLIAVHGGDKIAVFELDPRYGEIKERSRLPITPIRSSISDDRRMMSGPIAWNADGSQLIAAGNEGDSDVLIIDVEACGDRMTLRHAVSACRFEGQETGVTGILTANGRSDPPDSEPIPCPTPEWWPPIEPVGSPFVAGLPWASTGD